MRAAASSIASGSPSSLRQTCPTTGAVSGVSSKPPSTAAARSPNRITAGAPAIASGASPSAGTGSEPVRNTRSPGTPNGSRLVASRRSSGQARRRSSASRAHASTRCSQLSSTSSSSDSRRRSRTSSSRSLCGRSRTPRTRATALTTNCGSNTGARSTNQAPSRVCPAVLAASSIASRVFPDPPAPVKVTRRAPASSAASSASSRSRPTKLVSWSSRLWRRAATDRSRGNSRGRSGCSSWKRRSGRSTSRSRCAPRSRRLALGGRSSPASSRTAADTTTWPPCASARIAAQRITATPRRSGSTSPACSATRTTTCSPRGQSSRSTARWTSSAHARASDARANTAKVEPSSPR